MINRVLANSRKKTLTEISLESVDSSKSVLHNARILVEFDLREDSWPIKLEKRPRILVKLSFRELWDSKLSGWCTFGNIAISLGFKNILKVIFQNPRRELICHHKWHLGTSGISTPLDIAIGTQFHAQHGAKTSHYFLPAYRKPSLLLLQSLFS